MPQPPAFTSSDIPDQTGKLVVVTGANSGIGYETAKALADKGANVILACRSKHKARAAADAIGSRGGQVTTRALDLASLESVDAFAHGLLSDEASVDLLINNAGVMMPTTRTETADGFELQLGTNHLGHFLLTARLMPALERAGAARVVTVASLAHRFGAVDFEDLNWQRRRYKRLPSYGQSKLANLMFSFELARRLSAAGSKVQSLAAHPGWTATELQRNSPMTRFVGRFVAMRRSFGALPTLRAATELTARSGQYWGPSGLGELRGTPELASASKAARSVTDATRLWKMSEELVQTDFIFGGARSAS